MLKIPTKLRIHVAWWHWTHYAHAFLIVEHVFLLRFCSQEKCRWCSLRLECQHSPSVTSAQCRWTGRLPKCGRDSRPGHQMWFVCYNLSSWARVNTASTTSKLWGHADSTKSEQWPICWMWHMSNTILIAYLFQYPFVKVLRFVYMWTCVRQIYILEPWIAGG